MGGVNQENCRDNEMRSNIKNSRSIQKRESFSQQNENEINNETLREVSDIGSETILRK